MAVIFYFTGTGNSLSAAKCVAKGLKNCRLERMVDYIKKPYPVDEDMVGFVCPVYCFGLPPYLKVFFERLNVKAEYVFGIVTMGGKQGRALAEMSELLEKKGIGLNYAQAVAMPDNFFVKEKKVSERRLAETRPLLESIAGEIALLKRDVSQVKESGFWKKLGIPASWWFLKDVLRIDQIFEYSSRCVGCGVCAKVCPTGNIIMKGKKPCFYFDCANCLACKHWCPHNAIRVGGMKSQLGKNYTNPDITLQDIIREIKDLNE